MHLTSSSQEFLAKMKLVDDEGGIAAQYSASESESSNTKVAKQAKKFFNKIVKGFQQIQPERKSKYEVKKEENSDRSFLEDNAPSYDETTSMLTNPQQTVEFEGFNFLLFSMTFPPVFFILFYVPHPIFAIMHFMKVLSSSQYTGLQAGYMIFMCLVFLGVNVYTYYKLKKIKKDSSLKKEDQNHHLNKIFNRNSNQLVTPKNLLKILSISFVSIIGLIDTAFDIVFVAICYASGIVWLAIIIGLLYIYTFFDKIHSTRKLFGLVRDQYYKRYDRSLLHSDPSKAIQFYSACLSIFALPIAEILTRAHLRTLNLQRRVLLFEGVHIGLQKLIFIILKLVYRFIDSRNKSDMTSYALPFNFMCALLSIGFIVYKFSDLKRSNKNEELSNSGSQIKRFESQITEHSIRFRQNDASDIMKLEQIVMELEEGRRKAGASLNKAAIDKVKVKLLEGDIETMKAFIAIIKKQHFIREISFYKMNFYTDQQFECLSKFMKMRNLGVTKVSFKECTMKESMIGALIQKLDISKNPNPKSVLVKDITLQLKVSDQTDYEILYQQLRKLVENNNVQILFEPLFYSKRRDDNIFSKFNPQQLNILGETQLWPQSITAEYQHIKRFYLIKSTKNFRGQIFLFKDRNIQTFFDNLMYLKVQDLDLCNIRDIFTHTYHQERFIELVLRALEDNIDSVNSIQIRLMNDQGFQEKFNYLGIKYSQFKRLLRILPDNKIIKFHLNMSMFSVQDTKTIEVLFANLSDFIECQQKTLKELIFTEVQFDLNSNSEKDFYHSLSFPNLRVLVLNNCKFACYDSFERFFNNISDSENTLERCEINRLNSAVSAKGFREFLLSQSESLKHIILQGVHKNILSRKYHRKVLPAIAQISNLRTLSLKKNQLDYERLQVLADKMIPQESYQELQSLDLSSNLLENNSILIIYRMLKQRQFSLDYLDLSENSINEEGLNLLLKGKTDHGGHLLSKGLLANRMKDKNFLINNAKASKLDRLEVSGSFASGSDPSVAVTGFQMLGILNNQLAVLDASNNHLSSPQVQVMFDRYLQSKLCNLTSLNLSFQRLDDANIDSLHQYLITSPIIQTLILNDCRLRDAMAAKVLQGWFNPNKNQSIQRNTISLEGNLLGEQLFLNVLDDLPEDTDKSSPFICQKLSFARNNLTDEAVGNDFVRLLLRLNVQKIQMLDLSGNQRIGKMALIRLREHIEENPQMFCEIDLSDNPMCLKGASILELRDASENITVKYTRDQPKQVKKK